MGLRGNLKEEKKCEICLHDLNEYLHKSFGLEEPFFDLSFCKNLKFLILCD